VDQNVVRIAAADGATDAIFSGLWARMLVKSYGKHRMNAKNLLQRVSRLGQVWNKVVQQRPLPWYAEERIRAGAYAAFIGVELAQEHDQASGTWSALACGDSCFFQMRNDKVLCSFPRSHSQEFSNKPFLLSSAVNSNLDEIHVADGSWEEGDCFYLMTDALAIWFLSACEQEGVPWQILRDITLAKDPPFEQWIADLRRQHKIKNDDCTLVSVTFEHC
jgi:hypothetical protein